jgi:hypothetical protein
MVRHKTSGALRREIEQRLALRCRESGISLDRLCHGVVLERILPGNSCVRDIVDIVLMIEHDLLDSRRLREAVQAVWTNEKAHPRGRSLHRLQRGVNGLRLSGSSTNSTCRHSTSLSSW